MPRRTAAEGATLVVLLELAPAVHTARRIETRFDPAERHEPGGSR